MSAKLKGELKKAKKETQEILEKNGVLDRVENLLLGYEADQEKTLKDAGFRMTNDYESKLVEDYNRTKQAEKIYGQESFTGAQIKSLCQKYDLRMLSPRFYQGSIDVDLATKIDEFCRKNDLIVSDREIFILAPTECFKIVNETIPKNIDPIVFYRTDGSKESRWDGAKAQENDTFTQIHNWGSDFTEARKYRFLFDESVLESEQSSTNSFKMILLMISTLLVLASTLVGNWIFIGCTLFIAFISLIHFLFLDTETSNDEQWNTEKMLKQ